MINPDLPAKPNEGVESHEKRKAELRDADHSIHHLCILFEEFEPRCYRFIVFDCFRKLALTGLLIFVYPGTGVQLGFAIFVALTCLQYINHTLPYLERSNNNLAKIGQYQLCMVFLATMMLKFKDVAGKEGASQAVFTGAKFSILMIILGLTTLACAFGMIVTEAAEDVDAEDVKHKIEDFEHSAAVRGRRALSAAVDVFRHSRHDDEPPPVAAGAAAFKRAGRRGRRRSAAEERKNADVEMIDVAETGTKRGSVFFAENPMRAVAAARKAGAARRDARASVTALQRLGEGRSGGVGRNPTAIV